MPKTKRGDRKKEQALAEVKAEAERVYSAGWFERREIQLAFWQDGERMMDRVPFEWFFYLRNGDVEKVRRKLERRVEGLVQKGNHTQVYADFNERWELVEWLEEQGVQPLEADVTPFDRFMAENEVPLDPNPRVLYYDLETDSSDGGWDEIEKHRIISVAYRGPDTSGTEWLCAESLDDQGERKLLDQFLDVVEGHDIFVAWNGDIYDEPVLKARCKKQRIRPAWHMVRFLDLLSLFKKYYGRDAEGSGVRISFSLENVARTVLGKGKIEDVPKHRLAEIWKTDQDLLARYNVRDVDLMVDLDRKLGYIETHRILSHLCNRFLSSRSLRQSYVTDGFVLRYGAQHDVHFKTKKHDDLPEKMKIKGAHVEEPLRGLHRGVCDLDFSSLYPNIVMAFNISPEVRVQTEYIDQVKDEGAPHAVAENGAVFLTETEGVFPAVSRITVEGRQEFYKKAVALEKAGEEGSVDHMKALQTSNVWKILSNAFFGGMSSIYSRYYDPMCGEAITLTGQACIKRIFELAGKKGIPVVYGDTDSAFLKCSAAIAEEFNVAAADYLDVFARDRGARPGGFRLKVDAEFLRIFFTRKKKYAGKKKTGKVDVRGLELIRSDGCKLERELQRTFIDFLMEAENPSPQIAEKLLRKWARRIFAGDVEAEDLLMAETLAQPLENYKSETVHARIAKELLRTGREVYVGMKVPYILQGREDGRVKAIYAGDFDGSYDAVQYWRDHVYPATYRVLEAVFPDQKQTWDRFAKWNPGTSQSDLFEKGETLDGVPVTFRLRPEDQQHFEKLNEEMVSRPGGRPVKLELALDDGQVLLKTERSVALTPTLVKAMEGVVGHRVYYGPEVWDRGG